MLDMPKMDQKEFGERYNKLPPAVQEAIASVATADKVFDIGKRHNLTINKVGGLATQIGYIMLGLTRPKDFVDQLASALEVDKKSAQAIADDVNREIFYPVREHLRRLHNTPNEFPEPKLDTPASIFAEKMVSVGREPVKEVYITEKDARKSRPPAEGDMGKSHFLGEERLPERPGTKAKDSFAELRAELQREIETERGAEAGKSQPEKSGGNSQKSHSPAEESAGKSHFLGEERLPKIPDVQVDVGRPSPRPSAAPAYITEQRPSKPFALDEKESLPTPSRVGPPAGQAGTPISPPASVGAAVPSLKLVENDVGKSHFPLEERLPETKKSPASSPAAGQDSTGLLPAFRGYKMTGQPMQTVKPIESDAGKSHSTEEDARKSHFLGEERLPETTKPPTTQLQTQPPGQQKQNYSDPYREPAE